MQSKNQRLVSGQLEKTLDLNELLSWACDMVTWYWSANTLIWQVSVDHNMDVQHQRSTQKTKAACLSVNLLFGVWPPCCANHGFPFVSRIWDAYGAPLKTVFLRLKRVYLGVRTCELFPCFVAIVRVRIYFVDFFVLFVLRHWWVSQVLTPR